MHRSDPAAEILPSNRKFGIFWSALLLGLGSYLIWRHEVVVMGLGCALLAMVFAGIAIVKPEALRHLNSLWFKLGQLLGHVVGPIVLGAIFFLLITPIAWVTRRSGRDELRLKRTEKTSHWIERSPPGPPSDSFRNQF